MRLLFTTLTSVFGLGLCGAPALAQLRSQAPGPNMYINEINDGGERLQLTGGEFPDAVLPLKIIREKVKRISERDGGNLIVTVDTDEMRKSVEQVFNEARPLNPEATHLLVIQVTNDFQQRIPAQLTPASSDPVPGSGAAAPVPGSGAVTPAPGSGAVTPAPATPEPPKVEKPADPLKPISAGAHISAGISHLFSSGLSSILKGKATVVGAWDISVNSVVNNPASSVLIGMGMYSAGTFTDVVHVINKGNLTLGLSAGLLATIEVLGNINPTLWHDMSGSVGGKIRYLAKKIGVKRFSGEGADSSNAWGHVWRMLGSFTAKTLIKGVALGAVGLVEGVSSGVGQLNLNTAELLKYTAVEAITLGAIWTVVSYGLENLSYKVNNPQSVVSKAAKSVFNLLRVGAIAATGIALYYAGQDLTPDMMKSVGNFVTRFPWLLTMATTGASWALVARGDSVIAMSERLGERRTKVVDLSGKFLVSSIEPAVKLFKVLFVPKKPNVAAVQCLAVFGM